MHVVWCEVTITTVTLCVNGQLTVIISMFTKDIQKLSWKIYITHKQTYHGKQCENSKRSELQ